MKNVENFYSVANSLLENIIKKAPDIIFCVVVLVLGFVSIKISKKAINKYFEKINKLNSNFCKMSLKSVKLGIILATIILCLAKLNVPILSVFAVFSSSLFAVGLALKDFFCNIAKSIQIRLTSPFAVGDLIEIDSKKGVVQKIDYMHTYITNKEHGLVMVPNSLIADKSIINYSRGETKQENKPNQNQQQSQQQQTQQQGQQQQSQQQGQQQAQQQGQQQDAQQQGQQKPPEKEQS